jgi:hypothetical protein
MRVQWTRSGWAFFGAGILVSLAAALYGFWAGPDLDTTATVLLTVGGGSIGLGGAYLLWARVLPE